MNVPDYLANARKRLVDAERCVDDRQADRAEANTAIANAWIRMAEHATQNKLVKVFEQKPFTR